MFTVFLKHKFLSLAIFVLLFLSIICQIMVGVIFHRMIEESDNMPTTENKLLKQCKLKFINCYKLNGTVMNTSVFVDKFILKIRICGFSLVRLPHTAGQLMMLSVLVSGISVCLSLATGDTLFQIIPYYLVSILGLYFYFAISGIVDVSGKKSLLKTNLVDYLENHLMPRMEIEKETVKAEQEKPEKVMAKSEESPGGETQNTFDYVEELESLLSEFLV